ncbi:hypothetical protein IANJMKHF_00008 [Klebsiella phage CPRSA]|nr:hypothetical protein IANJMKHF_00008 [Klebsiella phage CPRSA]
MLLTSCWGRIPMDNLKWARESNIPEKYVGMFYQCNIDSKSPFEPENKIDLIVRTGFFL